ncbi:unnamed protein product [Effrenium voratum]|uniref:Glycosyltransferase 61 catalytic domain-containing protein n=1 Tax=Effrenium voratum TaxID=2562239 RepID=A0AA36JCU1_9DINO|nr:unnamed protein product [Effrenium voratum]
MFWLTWLPLAAGTYSALVDQIEEQARKAVELHGAGQVAAAVAKLEGAKGSFREAVRLDARQVDAYVAFGQAMLNTNQLQEAADAWENASQRISREKEPSLAAWVDGRLRWSKYGMVSMERDRSYAEGQGDLVKSVALIERQLEIYPDFPSRHHDLATTHVMLSETLEAASTRAVQSFRTAQERAVQAWRAGLKERGRAGPECSGRLVFDWEGELGAGSALVSVDPVVRGVECSGCEDHGAYVATFKNVGLSGDDGVIVDEVRCAVFLGSAGLAVDLAKNLQLLEVWGDPPTPYADGPAFRWFDFSLGRAPQHGAWESPVRVPRAASVVQFAGTSHFHVLTEVFGRLWVLREHGILADAGVRVVMPRAAGFLAAGFKVLTEGLGIAERIIHWTPGPNDVLLRAETLYFANWRVPVQFGKDGGHCPTPPAVLRNTRQALRLPAKAGPRTLVYVKRKRGDMRSVLAGEPEFSREIEKAAGWLAFTSFDGGLKPKQTIRLFMRARVVVGVHGGALANILFCQGGTELFELGFRNVFAGHYRFLAQALGLRHVLLPLKPDARGMGSHEVELEDLPGALDQIKAALERPEL